MVRLDTETKLITHALRMAAYNAETALARALTASYALRRRGIRPHPRSPQHQRRNHPRQRTLTIRLDPLSAPRRTRAIADLCN